jgi:hypothetical protein
MVAGPLSRLLTDRRELGRFRSPLFEIWDNFTVESVGAEGSGDKNKCFLV